MKEVSKPLLLSATLLGGTLWLTPTARAEPPAPATMLSFPQIMIVCNEKQFVEDLIAAERESKKAYEDKVLKLFEESRVCMTAYLINVVTGKSKDIGNVTWSTGEEHVWAMPFWDGKTVHWAMYEEKVGEAGDDI